jgi:hypothetical protein
MNYYSAYIKGDQANILGDNDVAVLGASQGKAIYEAEQLRAILQALKDKGIKKVIFLLGDTLQAYTHSIKNPNVRPEQFISFLANLGNQWINRNKIIIQETLGKNNYHILRWQDVKTIEGYQYYKDHLDSQSTDSRINQAIQETAKNFLSRLKRHHPKLFQTSDQAQRALHLSTQYIREETAAMINLGLQKKYPLFVYAGPIIKAFKVIQEEYLGDCLFYIQMGIKKNKKKINFFKEQNVNNDDKMVSKNKTNHISAIVSGITAGYCQVRKNINSTELATVINYVLKGYPSSVQKKHSSSHENISSIVSGITTGYCQARKDFDPNELATIINCFLEGYYNSPQKNNQLVADPSGQEEKENLPHKKYH